jgi:glycine/D-amino acid oxidase-like deaminating enzyme/nitrite reductase/ring-hydroxylating ferredoxin subunit
VHSQEAAASGSAEAQYSLQYERVPAWNSTSLWHEHVALSQRIETMAETSTGPGLQGPCPDAAGARGGWHPACEGAGHASDLAIEGVAMDRVEPGHLGAPLWRARECAGLARPLRGEIRADVVVVGAGITGLTAGWLLQSQGRSVALVEARTVGAGTTGATSAHVTSVLDVSYKDLLGRLGEERASLVVAGCERALDLVKSLGQGAVSCSFEGCPAYRYTEAEAERLELEAELAAARELGVAASLADGAPLPFPVKAALLFPEQGAFDPTAYLAGLAQLFVQAGGRLYVGARVTALEETQGGVVLETASGRLRAPQALLATHTPLGVNVVHAELVPYRSYLIAFRARAPLPPGLFWDTASPYHYLRAVRFEGENLVLLGGGDHKAGREAAPLDRFRQLEQFARERFGAIEVVRRWSSQLYEPLDGLPYVGRSPLAERVFVGTGYAGTGLVLGTLAAQIIADLVLGLPESELAALLRASRVPTPRAAGRAAAAGVDVALHFVKDRLAAGEAALAEIAPGQGAVVSLDGETLAVSRDGHGALCAVSAACTHMGCIVHWNEAERTWDCPCHGGRYAADGRVIEGPPLADLKPRPLSHELAYASTPGGDNEKGARRH